MDEIYLKEFLNLFENEDCLISLNDVETNEEILRAWFSDIWDSLYEFTNDFEFLRKKEYKVKGFDFCNGILMLDVY